MLATLILANPAYAEHSFSGVVKNSQGNPISNAVIELHGSNVMVKTDENGVFVLDEKMQHVEELHVSAPGYNHQTFSVKDADMLTESTALSQGDMAGSPSIVITLSKALIERIDVSATPLHGSTLESATPITVISDQDLKNKHAATLGETLKSELGVHSSYYGPVSSTPIIRGLDGPRVLIAQNGLDVGDASRVGPDHVVSTETSTVKQIEVLRGPATLFYGSGAIGGVVNIVDNRVPSMVEESAEWQLAHNTVSSENEFSFALNGGLETSPQIAWHIDGFYRDSGDYKVPAFPHLGETEADHEEHADEHDDHADERDHYTIENSASRAKGFNIGSSLILDNGFVGVSFGYLDRLYGIPGHAAHDDELDEEHGEEHSDELHEGEAHEEEIVKGDMRQTRLQIVSELNFENDWITGINTKLGLTDYQHKELEGHEVGTRFTTDSWQLRSDLLLAEADEWHGALTFDIKSNKFAAVGEEAFTPPSTTKSYAIGLLEEKHFGDVLVQLGARIEEVNISSQEHDFSFTPLSVSAGLVYDFSAGYNLGLSATHSSRAPSAAELLAFGPHIGTNAYEVGAIYNNTGTGLSGNKIDEERSNNLEISLRKFEGDTGFVVNAFYNQVDNFYYQQDLGLLFEDELQMYQYQAKDATFYGMEAQWLWQATKDLTVTLQTDSIVGELDTAHSTVTSTATSSKYLPRIPPARLGAIFNYEFKDTSLELSVMHNFEQNKTAELETATDAYTMVDLKVNHYIQLAGLDTTLFLKINNIFDEEARVHTSFLKNDTLLPSRGFTFGIRGMY